MWSLSVKDLAVFKLENGFVGLVYSYKIDKELGWFNYL